MIIGTPSESIDFIRSGKLVAYPTESIYGIGCDPFNQNSVEKIFKIKARPRSKPMILVASNISQLINIVEIEDLSDEVRESWPGHITWVIPCKDKCPQWLMNTNNKTVAIRISQHPVIVEMCDLLQSPIISTSANKTNEEPIKLPTELMNVFNQEIDFLVKGELGNRTNPSIIKEMETGLIIRE